MEICRVFTSAKNSVIVTCMVDRHLTALVSLVAWVALMGCRGRGNTPVDSGADAAVSATEAVPSATPSAAASAQPAAWNARAARASDARGVVAKGAACYGLFNESSDTWRVDMLPIKGESTSLGTQSRYGDHAALAADDD
ncbi:MAG TPA: hypothetical protein VM580_23615, partial [Labilithrix sp.]|nr:hypothetical protein [Labilithrix sp.]